MFDKKQIILNGHGFFRKKKWAKGLVSGIAIAGVAVFSSNAVLANEITTSSQDAVVAENPNPATNLVEAQEAQTTDAVASQKQADTSIGEVTAVIESPKLDEAVKQAQDTGVTIETGETKTVTDLSEAESSYEKQAEEVKQVTDTYASTKKEVEASNQAVDAVIKQAQDLNVEVTTETKEITDSTKTPLDNTQVDSAKDQLTLYKDKVKHFEDQKASLAKKYEEEKAVYDRQLADLKAKTNTTGYLTKALSQDLVWNNEPKATLKTITTSSAGKIITNKSSKEEIDSIVTAYNKITGADFGHIYKDIVLKGGATAVLKKVGDSVTVIHSGLKNSRVGATVIDSVKTVYTLIKNDKDPAAPVGNDVLLAIYQDPTTSARTTVSGGKVEYDIALTYYDATGKEISLAGNSIVLGASSLNHEDTFLYGSLSDSFEYASVKGTNGTFVPINGSSITVHSDDRAYADFNNASKGKNGVNGNGKAPFQEDWDTEDSPNFYYGAIAVHYANPTNNTLHIKLGAEDREEYWFTLNSHTPGHLPTKPTPPKPLKPFLNPLKLSLTKYTVLTPKLVVNKYQVTQTPAISKAVQNDSGDDVNGKMVAKGSVDPFILQTEAMEAGREVVEQGSYVLVDNLPTGYKLDLKATQDANKDYVVTYDKATHTLTAVATEALINAMNADLKVAFDTPDFTVIGSPQNDNGKYVNNYSLLINDYKVYSNTVTIYTPGGEEPENGSSTIQPRKKVVDDKGNDIHNKSVLKTQTMNYLGTHNLDQYKGMKAGLASVLKGFAFVDDYFDDALDGNSLKVNSITASNGDDVSKLMTMYHVLSPDTLSEELRNLVLNSGISPVGAFYLWVANNPEDFYSKYVQQGLDITYNLSFKIKDGFVKGDITNQVSQIDFGNGYYGNIVVNKLTPPEVSKDVLDKKDGSSIDNGEVKLGDNATYKLTGWVVPAGRGYDLYQYTFKDKLQVTHDEYQNHEVTLSVDVVLQDGTVIKAGEDLSQYTTYDYNKETGQFELVFKEDFLRSISRDSGFGADVTITVKRIKAGTVENEYTLTVNGDEVISNKVVTTTPEPPQPVKEAPVQSAGVLPRTGETGSILGSLGIVMLSVLAFLSFKKVREED